MDTFDRGETLQFTFVTDDINGNPVLPSGAYLEISYYDRSRVKTTTRIEMSPETDGFAADWNSTVAYPGIISWVMASEDAFVAAQQGQFILAANDANL